MSSELPTLPTEKDNLYSSSRNILFATETSTENHNQNAELWCTVPMDTSTHTFMVQVTLCKSGQQDCKKQRIVEFVSPSISRS